MAVFASFDYDEMSEGGSLFESGNVKVIESKACMYDFNGKTEQIPCVYWKLENTEDGEICDQYWGAGKASDWTPSEDGKRLVAIGTIIKASKGTNAGILMKHLKESGLPNGFLSDGDLSRFEGLECYMERVSGYRKGLENTKNNTVLVVKKIHSLPGEGKAVKSKSRAKSRAKTTAGTATTEADTGSSDGDVRTLAEESIMNCLLEKGGEVAKATLIIAVQKVLKGNPLAQAVSNLIFKGDVLEKGPWKYEGGKVSME
jgi:hypothetical protein